MVPRGWEEEAEDAAWTDEYDDEFEDEEFDDEEEELLEEDEFEDEEPEEEDEDELEALIDEGEALIEEGEYGAALDLFREAAERFPESPLAIYKVGHTALMLFSDGVEETNNWQDDDDLAGFYEEALNAFDAAITLDAEYYPALNGQGALYMVAENIEAALDCWQRSVDISPDQEEILTALEEARRQLEG